MTLQLIFTCNINYIAIFLSSNNLIVYIDKLRK